MSQVKKRDVIYPYVNVEITSKEKASLEEFINNLKLVLIYIGSDEDVIHEGEDKILGRAYKN